MLRLQTLQVALRKIPQIYPATYADELQAWKDEYGDTLNPTMTVNLCTYSHLKTLIEFDFYPNGIVEIEAVLDTGSQVSFLNQAILSKHATHLLKLLKPCPIQFLGIKGKAFLSPGFIPLSCKIEGKIIQSHSFVIANIVETALLGLDFWNKYEVNWNYLRGCLTYDTQVYLVTQEHGQCQLET